MNSKYSGEQVEAILNKAEISDSFKIGEIRCSSSPKNPFGDDYVLCAGQEVSLKEYPKAVNVLPVTGITTAKRIDPFNMSTSQLADTQSYTFFSINNTLLGRLRIMTTIPKDTNNVTPEDMITMLNDMETCLDVSEDGINWIEKYKFPKQQGVICNSVKVDILNDKIVIFCQIGTASLVNETPTINIQGNKIFTTNDFQNFKNWTESDFILPGEHNNEEIDLIQSAYGNGIYIIAVRTSNKMLSFFKSPNLTDWEYINSDICNWEDVSSNPNSTSIFFCGGYFILQCVYTFIFSDPDLMAQSVIDGKGTDADGNRIDDVLLGVECLQVGDIVEYCAITANKVFAITKSNDTGEWESEKQPIPNDLGGLFSIKALGNGFNFFIFSRHKNKYLVYPTNNTSIDYTVEGDSASQYVSYVGLHQFNDKLYLEDQGSIKNVLVNLQINTPQITVFSPYGLFGYVKLR